MSDTVEEYRKHLEKHGQWPTDVTPEDIKPCEEFKEALDKAIALSYMTPPWEGVGDGDLTHPCPNGRVRSRQLATAAASSAMSAT